MNKSSAILIASLLATGAGFNIPAKEPREPKNKYGLTHEEIELLKTLTPKEKKKYLRTKVATNRVTG